MKFATRLLTLDPAPGDRFTPANTPIYQTATFRQDDATEFGEYDYSRSGNPTRAVVEKQIAALENGTRGFCFSTGLAAITAVTRLVSPGEEILACDDPASTPGAYCANRTVQSQSLLPVLTSACTACHDSPASVAHAQANVAQDGTESCAGCHGAGEPQDVQTVHTLPP